MARYSDTLTDQNNVPIVGALVAVKNQDGSTPVLTDDDGDTLLNPLATNGYGTYYFNADAAFYDLKFYYGGRLIRENYGVEVGLVTLPTGFIADAMGVSTIIAPSQRAVTTALNAETTRATSAEGSLNTRLTAAETEIDGTVTQLSQALTTGTISLLIEDRIYTSRALLDADLVPADDLYALVVGDPTAANNDLYQKNGVTTAGSWDGPLGIFAAASAEANDAAAIAEAARDQIVAAAPNTATARSEDALRNLEMADNNGLTVTGRAAAIGCAFNIDFANSAATLGLFSQPPALAYAEFSRTGTGTAIGGNSTTVFAENAPRIQAGQLQIDGGGTNLILSSANMVHANWTKTNLGTPVASDGIGGVGSATYAAETTANGFHGIMQQFAVASGTTFIYHAIVKATGRSFAQFRCYNSATSIGYTCRWSLSGDGAVVAGYPAVLIGSVTGLKQGITHLGDGYYLLWLSGIFGSAQTTLRHYIELMSSSTVASYVGSTSCGLELVGAWVTTGQAPSNYIASTDTVNGSRAAETMPVALGRGYYLRRVVDEAGELLTPLALTTLGERWNIAPRADKLRVISAQAYILNAYDTMTRADTAAGSLGTATDGGTYQLLKNPGSFPMVAAINGQVLSNAFAFTPQAGANGAVYAVREMGAGVIARFLSADVAWDTDSGSAGNTAFALLTSNDLPNLTARMPAHCIIGRTNLRIQYRTVADGFVTLGVIKPALGSLAKDGTYYSASVAIQGNKAKITWAGYSIIVQNDILLEETGYACFELFSDHAVGANTDHVKGKNLLASVAEVGDDLTYTAVVPVNIVLPFASGTPVAGNTYTANSTQGGWTSNNGDIAFTYQWQFNGVDIPGATNASLVTVAVTDVGKTVSVRVIATNASGSTSATSPASAALA